MLEPDLPHEVLYRPKMGFRVPLAAWLRGPLRGHVHDALCGRSALTESGWFEPAVLERLVHQHGSGRRDHSATLWKLLMLDAFLRRMHEPTSAVGTGPAKSATTATLGAAS
jgi:asparagine synthase (glutamine-hydrolysing)